MRQLADDRPLRRTHLPVHRNEEPHGAGRARSDDQQDWEDQIFYCLQRGIDEEQAISLIVNGYAKEVLNKLPMEFAVEAQKLLAISLEGSVG